MKSIGQLLDEFPRLNGFDHLPGLKAAQLIGNFLERGFHDREGRRDDTAAGAAARLTSTKWPRDRRLRGQPLDIGDVGSSARPRRKPDEDLGEPVETLYPRRKTVVAGASPISEKYAASAGFEGRPSLLPCDDIILLLSFPCSKARRARG